MNTWYFLIKRDAGVIICLPPYWSSSLLLLLFFISGPSAKPSRPLIPNAGLKPLAWPGCYWYLFSMWFGSSFYSNRSRLAFFECMKTRESVSRLIPVIPMASPWVAAGQPFLYPNWFLLPWSPCLCFQYFIGPSWIMPGSAWATNSIHLSDELSPDWLLRLF